VFCSKITECFPCLSTADNSHNTPCSQLLAKLLVTCRHLLPRPPLITAARIVIAHLFALLMWTVA